MKKYRVTYSLYGSGSDFAEYNIEFISTEDYAYDVAVFLTPSSVGSLGWMIDRLEEIV